MGDGVGKVGGERIDRSDEVDEVHSPLNVLAQVADELFGGAAPGAKKTERPRSTKISADMLADRLQQTMATAAGGGGGSALLSEAAGNVAADFVAKAEAARAEATRPKPGPAIKDGKFDFNHPDFKRIEDEIANAKTPEALKRYLGKEALERGKKDPYHYESYIMLHTLGKAVDRVAKEGTKEHRKALAQAVLGDPLIPAQAKLAILNKLTDPAAQKDPKQRLSFEEVVAKAPPEVMRGLGEAMSVKKKPNPADVLPAETQLKAMRAVIDSEELRPEERGNILKGMLENTSKEKLNYVISHASADRSVAGEGGKDLGRVNERQMLAAVITVSPELQKRLAKELTPENRTRFVDDVLTLPVKNRIVGGVLSNLVKTLDPKAKNDLVNHLQKTGRIRDFLETQTTREQTEVLLDGLDADNLALVGKTFRGLAKELTDPANVTGMDPDAVGRTISRSTVTTDSVGTAHTDQSQQKVGAKVGGSLGVPGVASISSEVNAEYAWGTSDTKSYGSSTAKGDAETIDEHKRAETKAKAEKWANSRPYDHAADHVDAYAKEVLKDKKAWEEYKEKAKPQV